MSRRLPPAFPVVAIGTSAGGVEALWAVLSGLPAGLEAAVLVVMHIPPHTPSRLHHVLQRRCRLPVRQAGDHEALAAGHVYVASADRHLMIEGGLLRCTRGPTECRVRPSANVLFRSVAESCGPRAVGVVLSGTLDDGTAGLWAIKDRGGRALVQAPDDAMYDGMPRSALEHVAVDAVAPAHELGPLIAREVRAAAAAPGFQASTPGVETRVAAGESGLENAMVELGIPSRYACPECHGVLNEIREGRILRYRCHTGHGYSVQTLAAELDRNIDESLWNTLRALEERMLLLEQVAAANPEGAQAGQLARLRARMERVRSLVLAPAVEDGIGGPAA